jgi:hypothetical protein
MGSTMKRATALVTVLAMTLVACGGGDGDEAVSAAPVVVEAEQDQAVSTDQGTEPAAAVAGDTDTAGSATSSSATEATDEERALDFAQCMRDNGVDFPDPVINADGSIDLAGNVPTGSIDPTSDTFNAAVEVCGSIVGGASFLPGAGIDETEQQALLLGFAECLRGLGHDVIDPVLSDIQAGGPGALASAFGENFDPTDPANAGAVQECQAQVAGASDE